MRLVRFRVENFRSINDSGWVTCEDVTSLVGVNEAGKSNLLLALWKLNPAREGEIDLLKDLPRARYTELRNAEQKPRFITAEFELGDRAADLAEQFGVDADELSTARVARRFDGWNWTEFPEEKARVAASARRVRATLDSVEDAKLVNPEGDAEVDLLNRAKALVAEHRPEEGEEWVPQSALEEARDAFGGVDHGEAKGTPASKAVSAAAEWFAAALREPPVKICSRTQACHHAVLAAIPSFVYYSNYGNLDSEIYLPHVIENLARKDLGPKEAAKARTLRVLFEFVGLSPDEILKLGEETENANAEQIEEANQRKKEREVLLHSASTMLTKRFRDWWKQGTYQFDFGADGRHFRIWVSDEKRPDKVELESRSTGLQWFLSFYLIFLVEAQGEHKGCILLLDEAGVTLHPLAQADLIDFFSSLASGNQLVHTTHSPFLIDIGRIDRARSVYVDEAGFTTVSPDLRRSEADPSRTNSVFAVHAALGLSVSETLLHGCAPVIVEGVSDQFYLSTLAQFLIGQGVFSPHREVVFAPCGGVRGVKPLAGLLMAKDGELPPIVLDADGPGTEFSHKLKSGLYQGSETLVLDVGAATGIVGAEIEDLLPPETLAKEFDRMFAAELSDISASDDLDVSKPIRPQLEATAMEAKLELPKGWTVDLARRACRRLRRRPQLLLSSPRHAAVQALFAALSSVLPTG